MKLSEIQKRLAAVIDEMDELKEVGFDKSGRDEFDALEIEAARLQDLIEDEERLDKHSKRKAWAGETKPDDKPKIEMGDGPSDRGFRSFDDHLEAIWDLPLVEVVYGR